MKVLPSCEDTSVKRVITLVPVGRSGKARQMLHVASWRLGRTKGNTCCRGTAAVAVWKGVCSSSLSSTEVGCFSKSQEKHSPGPRKLAEIVTKLVWMKKDRGWWAPDRLDSVLYKTKALVPASGERARDKLQPRLRKPLLQDAEDTQSFLDLVLLDNKSAIWACTCPSGFQ